MSLFVLSNVDVETRHFKVPGFNCSAILMQHIVVNWELEGIFFPKFIQTNMAATNLLTSSLETNITFW